MLKNKNVRYCQICLFLQTIIQLFMTKEEKVAYWLDLADYDIETAEGLFVVKRWLYVGFMCHQVIEKTLKSYWCKTRDDDPPYIHNFEQQRTIAQLMPMNIEARYPEYKEQLLQRMTQEFCRQLIDDTRALQQWIRNK